MENIEVATLEDLARTVTTRAKSNAWYVLRFNGYAFKIYEKWAQIMQSPSGARDSGASGHKSARALVAEITAFMGAAK